MTEAIPLNASARILYQEALQRGITCTLFEDRNLIMMEKGGTFWYTCGSRISGHSSVGKTIADNKAFTKKILQKFNLPTAAAASVKSEEDLILLHKLQLPLVMKPLWGRHGTGVIVGIEDHEKARQLFNQQGAEPVIFEEMLKGIEYRVICVNFQFVAAAFRKPAHVVGDGRSTIQQLIDLKNQHPWRGRGHEANLTVIDVDPMVTEYLAKQSLTISSVLASGQEVMLRKTANLSTGGEAWDVTEQVSPENRVIFEQIARVCDLNVIGIDVMCESLSTPFNQQPQAGVIEVNASPGLRMHHFPLQGDSHNVAAKILDMLDKQ